MAEEEIDEDLEGWFEDTGVEALEAMTEFLKLQQKTALKLTKLVLEHCKFEKLTKEQVFNIFQEASKVVGRNAKSS